MKMEISQFPGMARCPDACNTPYWHLFLPPTVRASAYFKQQNGERVFLDIYLTTAEGLESGLVAFFCTQVSCSVKPQTGSSQPLQVAGTGAPDDTWRKVDYHLDVAQQTLNVSLSSGSNTNSVLLDVSTTSQWARLDRFLIRGTASQGAPGPQTVWYADIEVDGESSCRACPANSDAPAGSDAIRNCVCSPGYTQSCEVSDRENKNAVQGMTADTASAPSFDTQAECEQFCCSSPECYIWTYNASSATCFTKTWREMVSANRSLPSDWPDAAGQVQSGRVKKQDYVQDRLCTSCGAGKFKSTHGQDTCHDCPRDSYNSSNNTFCVACPDNAYSAVSSAELTDCRCNVGYSGDDGGECVACDAGHYKDTNGSAPCTQCPAGESGESGGK